MKENYMNKKLSRVLLGVLNLLAISSPFVVSPTAHAAATEKKISQVNTASLKAIESTWLKVPKTCKARGFHAEAVSLENKTVNSQIQKIYSSFNV